MAHGLKAEKLATLLLDQQRVTLYFACSNFCDFCVFPRSIRKIKFQQKSPPQFFNSTGEINHTKLTYIILLRVFICKTSVEIN